MRDIVGVGDERERERERETSWRRKISPYFLVIQQLVILFFGVQSLPTVHPGYKDSGYHDIFFTTIRSHGIDYACTLSQPL